MIKAYTDTGGDRSLVAPYVGVAAWVDPDFREIIDYIVKEYFFNYETATTRLRDTGMTKFFTTLGTLNRVVDIHRKKGISPPFLITSYTATAQDITHYGDLAIVDISNRQAGLTMMAKLIHSYDLYNEHLIYVGGEEVNDLEALLAYIYAGVLRYNWFRFYNHYYRQLNLISNWGNATREHLETLLTLHYLPEFYIWRKVMRSVARFCEENVIDTPDWYKKEREKYDYNISFNDDQDYALRL